MIINQNERRKILPIASGKGGVGKTLLAINCAIGIASQGRKVLLVDLDVGSANCHTLLGIKNHNIGIGNYALNTDIEFNSIIQKTPYPNLSFISGDCLIPNAATMHAHHHQSIINHITDLPYDYIIIDLPSGGATPTLYDFMRVNSGLLVSTPDLPSILSLYNFMHSALIHHCYDVAEKASKKKIHNYLNETYCAATANNMPKISEILLGIENIDGNISSQLRDEFYAMKPVLIMNRLQEADDLEMAKQVCDLIENNLGIKVETLGAIFEDEAIGNSMHEQKPLMASQEDTPASIQIDRVCQKILLSPDFPDMPIDYDMYDSSYAIVNIEVNQDFQSLQQPGGSALDHEEHLATIESQAQTIKELEQKVSNLESKTEFSTHLEQNRLPHAAATPIEDTSHDEQAYTEDNLPAT